MPDIDVLLAGVFGLLIGSFLNVCIYRLPRDLSVVRPRSHCPSCDAPIRSFENIPVLSYLALRGRCGTCRTPISLRYPAVELLTALLFAYFSWHDGPGWPAVRDCVFSAILVALLFTDLETRLLPESLTVGGIAAGLIFACFIPVSDGTAHALFGWGLRVSSVADSLLGAVVPAFALWFTGWIFEKVRKKQGLGFGDVMMIAAIGAFLGVRATLLTLILASLTGSIVGVAYIVVKRKDAGSYELPLGAFLSVAGISVAAFGSAFIRWYLNLMA